MTLVRLDVEDPRWRAFLERSPDATPFHHPAWSAVLADCYGYRPFALAAEEDGRIVAGIPAMEVRGLLGRRRWLSLPFTDACAPLGDGRTVYAGLGEARGELVVEVRAPAGVPGAHTTRDEVTHVLPLGDDPLCDVRSHVRRNVAKAQRAGVTVRRAATRRDLVETYYALHVQTRRRLGVPTQPRAFFERLWERMFEPGLAFLLVAHLDNEPVAGAVFLSWNGTVVYKFGASDAAAWSVRPNDALFAHALRTSAEQGAHTFDFGKTELANEGLRRFKAGWGAEEVPLVHSTLGAEPRRARFELAAAAGGVIRRSPDWVCRAAGVLYRYAA